MSRLGRTIEGSWEEVARHADELRGCRVRLTVVEERDTADGAEGTAERHLRMLAALDEIRAIEWTEEERKALDEFEDFRRQHPFRLRKPWELQ